MADKPKPVYIMVPKKLMTTWIIITVILFGLSVVSIQYTNYVAGLLCGIINISNDTYKANPPPSATGKAMAREFSRLHRKYHCS